MKSITTRSLNVYIISTLKSYKQLDTYLSDLIFDF